MSAEEARHDFVEGSPLRTGGVLADAAIAGLAGALASSIPHTVLDLIAGDPLRTPLALYGALIGNGASPAVEALLFTGLHLAAWCVIGGVIAAAVSLVDLRPRMGSTALVLTLVAFCTAVSFAHALSGITHLGLPVWLGTITGALASVGVLILRHRSVLDYDVRRALTQTTRFDLDVAYREERRALDYLSEAHRVHPSDETLEALVEGARHHVALLEGLFEAYALEPPTIEPTGAGLPHGAIETVYAQAAQLNAGRRALYDRFLVVVDEPRVRTAFEQLRFAAESAIAHEAWPHDPWRPTEREAGSQDTTDEPSSR